MLEAIKQWLIYLYLHLEIPIYQEITVRLIFEDIREAQKYIKYANTVLERVLRDEYSGKSYDKVMRHVDFSPAILQGDEIVISAELSFDEYGKSKRFLRAVIYYMYYHGAVKKGEESPFVAVTGECTSEWNRYRIYVSYAKGEMYD